jgi:hypothetical protein
VCDHPVVVGEIATIPRVPLHPRVPTLIGAFSFSCGRAAFSRMPLLSFYAWQAATAHIPLPAASTTLSMAMSKSCHGMLNHDGAISLLAIRQ